MTTLSVNVNKVATLRNSRGGDVPNLLQAVDVILAGGVRSITVHPRLDERHIKRQDVLDIAAFLEAYPHAVEFNMEGDPRPDFLELVEHVRPTQVTLVPVRPGEVTSEAGWPSDTPRDALLDAIGRCQRASARVSIFVDPELEAVRWSASLRADRIELYTEPYARAAHAGGAALDAALSRYAACAAEASRLGLAVNAGHDLDLDNLAAFLAQVQPVQEVSIGHALMSRALFVGLPRVVAEYLALVE